MKECTDGYPSCRKAEQTGSWCKARCLAALQKELDLLLLKRAKIREAIMNRFHNYSATRARTTTANANVDRLNDLIVDFITSIRKEIKETK